MPICSLFCTQLNVERVIKCIKGEGNSSYTFFSSTLGLLDVPTLFPSFLSF